MASGSKHLLLNGTPSTEISFYSNNSSNKGDPTSTSKPASYLQMYAEQLLLQDIGSFYHDSLGWAQGRGRGGGGWGKGGVHAKATNKYSFEYRS